VTTPPVTETCTPGESDANIAMQALSECWAAHASESPGAAAEASLTEHLEALRTAGEVTPDEAQRLAEIVWALLDRLPVAPATSDARAHGEDAAEGLLRDRSGAPSRHAAETAIAAVHEIAGFTDPHDDPCAALRTAAFTTPDASPCTTPRRD
jgi:hypothetical protein